MQNTDSSKTQLKLKFLAGISDMEFKFVQCSDITNCAFPNSQTYYNSESDIDDDNNYKLKV